MPSQSPPLMQQRHQPGLLGPRPATLKVTTNNNNMKKRPVIIYVESPKVVHAHPSEFKSVVQHLTGAPPPLQFPFQLPLVATTASSSLPPPPMAMPADVAAASSVVRSLGLFISDDQLISPAPFLLYDHHQSQATAANPPPSLGACYRHGDLFVNH